MRRGVLGTSALVLALLMAQPTGARVPDEAVFAAARTVQPKVVAWRRDIHQHPELSNREVRTARMVAAHLERLGFEVRTDVAKTGVIGILRGARPGPVVALRADMDALPVREQTGLPFASKVTTQFNDATVDVMHACGHDAHVAILMGAAEVLASLRSEIPGTVVLIFQPAEEGPPLGETGGAPLLLAERALADPKPDAIFGLHVVPGEAGKIYWRPGPMMAASDGYTLKITGKQTHGANPWLGIDIASLQAEIVLAFNQIAARQVNLSRTPTVLTVATVHGGVRQNIIPDEMTLTGTLRTFDPELRKDVMSRVEATIASIAGRYGGKAEIAWNTPNPVTTNDPALGARMAPTLSRAAGGNVDGQADYMTGAEDFSYYARVAPSLFYRLGIGSPAGTNHSPLFDVTDERALEVGVRTQVLLALDYLGGGR